MSKIHIAFLVNTIYGVGGVQRVLSSLANKLAENCDVSIVYIKKCSDSTESIIYNYDPKICLLHEERLDWTEISFIRRILTKINLWLKSRNIISIHLRNEVYYPKRIRNRLVKYINKKQFDCIIGVQGDATIILALLKKRLKSKCIGWLHNSFVAYFETAGRYYYGQRLMFKKYMHRMDQCIVLTKSDEMRCKDAFGCKTTNIYNPVTISTDKKSKNDNTVLFCGRLVKRQKGLDYLLEIIKKVMPVMPDWKFAIVGDGEDREWLENEIRQTSIADRVTFYGDQKDVIPYYLNAAIMALTSRWEGFGLVVTEAFEAGVPVVSFRTEGPSEIINDRVNGILVDNYDTDMFSKELISLMQDTERRHRMAYAAIERARDFSSDMIASQWYSLINEVIKT